MKYAFSFIILLLAPLFLFSQQSNTNGQINDLKTSEQQELNNRIISKAAWDTEKNQIGVTETFTGNSGGPFEFLTGFKIDNQAGEIVESIYFHVAANTGEALGKQKLVAYIYLWQDDGDNQMEHHELSIAAKASIHFNDKEANTAFLNVPVTDIRNGENGWTIPSDDTRVFVGIRQLTEGYVFIGFDETTDLSLGNRQTGIEPIDMPHYWTVEWEDNLPFYLQSFRDFHAAPSIGMVLQSEMIINTQKPFKAHAIEIYPNPVSGKVSVHVSADATTGQLLFTIYNNLGSIVYSNTSSYKPGIPYQMDVQNLPPGFYVLHVKSAETTGVVPFVIQR